MAIRLENKAQAQLISVVILTSITISLVAITYFWGMPIMEKEKSSVRLSSAEKFMKELNRKLEDVIKNGGTQVLEANVPGTLTMVDNGVDDKLELNFSIKGCDIALQKDIFLIGDEKPEAVLGEEPSVLKVYAQGSKEFCTVTMTLYYRNVTSSKNIYVVDLVGLGSKSITGKNHKILISMGESRGVVGERNGRDVYETKVNIRLE